VEVTVQDARTQLSQLCGGSRLAPDFDDVPDEFAG